MLAGLAQFWISGEWHRFPDDTHDLVFENFGAFYDEDRDMNSVDFLLDAQIRGNPNGIC